MLPQYQHGYELAKNFASQELAKKKNKLNKEKAAGGGATKTTKKDRSKKATSSSSSSSSLSLSSLSQGKVDHDRCFTDDSTEGHTECTTILREQPLHHLPSSPAPPQAAPKKTKGSPSVCSNASSNGSVCSTPQSHRSSPKKNYFTPDRSMSSSWTSSPFTASSMLLLTSCAIETMRKTLEHDKCHSLQDLIQHDILAPLQAIHDKLEEQRHDLQATIEVQTDRARARYTAQNKTGTVISLRRIQRTQWELETVQEAKEYVSAQIQEVERTQVLASSSSTALQQLLDNHTSIEDCLGQVQNILQSVNVTPSLSGGCGGSICSGVGASENQDHSTSQQSSSSFDHPGHKDEDGHNGSTSDNHHHHHHHHLHNLTDEQLLQEFAESLRLSSSSSLSDADSAAVGEDESS
ncbi:hypothetical protein ACA910_015400 [Epithemia clementina (nom. ined.)]